MPTNLDPEILARLERDVRSTIGGVHVHLVAEIAARAETLEIGDIEGKVIEDVQQVIHDTFVSATWPACPLHLQHPLWFRDGAWWCDLSSVRVASLGDLPATTST
jgi:hypothetical protein